MKPAMNYLYHILINNCVFSLIKNCKKKLNMQESKSLKSQLGRRGIWFVPRNSSSLGTIFKNYSETWHLVIFHWYLKKYALHNNLLVKAALRRLSWSKEDEMTITRFLLQSKKYLIGAKMILFSKEECSFLVTFKPVHSTAIDVTRHNTMPRQQRMLKTFEYGEWSNS